MNDSLARLEEATERTEEVADLKNKFISTVSHELLTPLTAIRAYTEALLEHIGSTNIDMQRQFLGVINEQSLKLRRLIDSILELSQLESGRFRMSREPFNLVGLMDEVVQVKLPGSATTFHVPDGLLASGTKYKESIGAVTSEGNATFAETSFTTARK